MRSWSRIVCASVWLGLALSACGGEEAAQPSLVAIPSPDLSAVEPLVAELIEGRMGRVRTDPKSARAWADLGFALDAHMKLEEAEACLAESLELDGDYFPAAYDHAVLGTLLPREVEEVTARFRRAVALQPDYAPALARQGDYLLAAGKAEEAAASYRSALEVWPAYGYAQLGLARAQLAGEAASGWRDAVDLLSPLFASFTADPAVATALGQALSLSGKTDEAAAVSAKHAAAVDLGGAAKVPLRDNLRAEVLSLSRTAVSNFQRGERKLRKGDFRGASVDFERVLSVEPTNRAAHLLLARAKIALREPASARAVLKRLLETSAGDPGAHALLGQLDAESGASSSALKHIQAASRAGALDGATWRAWVTVLGAEGRWDEALFRIDEWRLADPAAIEPLYLKALAHRNAGESDKAQRALDEAIQRAPTHPMRRQFEAPIRSGR